MAALDLEEQEQLAEFKAWWNRYGNLVLTAVTLVLLVIAGINGWNYYQRTQATASAKVFEGLQKLAVGGDAAVDAKVLCAGIRQDLAEVEHVYSGFRFGNGNGFEFPRRPDGFATLPDQRASRGSPSLRHRRPIHRGKPGFVPAGHFLARIVNLAFVNAGKPDGPVE